VFIEFKNFESAQLTYTKLLSEEYDKRDVKIVYVSRDVFEECFAHLDDNLFEKYMRL